MRGVCKPCIKESDALRNLELRAVNRIRQNLVERSISKYVTDFKTGRPCNVCGDVYDPVLMHFDHLDRSVKVSNLSSIKSCHSLEKVLVEISKCQILCIFCHRKKTNVENKDLAVLTETRSEYSGPGHRLCVRCDVPQNGDKFLVCKGVRINVCVQCERERSREKRRMASEYVDSVKASNPCVDCGKRMDPCCMDFDHLPGSVKTSGVCVMVSKGYGVSKISQEIGKCDLVCAGCHTLRTRSRLMLAS